MFRKTGTLETKKKPKLRRNKLFLGFAGALAAAVVGSAGVAAAHPAPQTMYMPTRGTCDAQYHKYHFKSRNDCRSYWDHHKQHGHGHGHHHGNNPGNGNGHDNNGGDNGYGGNGGGVVVIINNNGDGNVIVIIINSMKNLWPF